MLVGKTRSMKFKRNRLKNQCGMFEVLILEKKALRWGIRGRGVRDVIKLVHNLNFANMNLFSKFQCDPSRNGRDTVKRVISFTYLICGVHGLRDTIKVFTQQDNIKENIL